MTERTMAPQISTFLYTALLAFTVGAGGCARQSSDQPMPSQAQIIHNGAEMQSSGTMSQADYVKIDGLEHQTYQTHQISDKDLDWTLELLQTATNSIARARAMTVLSEIRSMSAAQKAKIAPAIAPYLASTDALDQLNARKVQRVMQGG